MMDYNCSKQLGYGKEFCTNLSKFNALGNNMVKTMINSHQTNGLDLLNGLNGQQLSPINQNHHLTHDLNHAPPSLNQNLLLQNHNGLHHGGDLHHNADHHLAGGSIGLNSSTNGQTNGGSSGNCANSSSTNSSNSSSSANNKQKRHRTRFTPNQLQQLEVRRKDSG